MAIIVATSMLSCRRDHRLKRYRPLRLDGVPVIRVRVAADRRSVCIFTTKACNITAGGVSLVKSKQPLSATTVRRSGGLWHCCGERIVSKRLEIEGDATGLIHIDRKFYRGKVSLIAIDAERFFVVNELDMESYLAGVLAKELYHNWSLQTYRALAVAARTFALYQMRHFGLSHRYDLTNTQGSQVYGGFADETDKSWRAVRGTHGKILTYGPTGRERIFLAQYSACCGGYVNDARVMRPAPQIEPLIGGQRCDDCRACKYYTWPTVKVAKSELFASLAAIHENVRRLGRLSTIRVV
ncbi:MAG: SpoIID/LytB domain-containing protein, partial [Planctomycetes bacterium]|nr:SpoIID/LytB domain-containing protein [Planctomycetota bacterium]